MMNRKKLIQQISIREKELDLLKEEMKLLEEVDYEQGKDYVGKFFKKDKELIYIVEYSQNSFTENQTHLTEDYIEFYNCQRESRIPNKVNGWIEISKLESKKIIMDYSENAFCNFING